MSRHETQGRLKRLANLLPAQRDVPAIVRIVEGETACAGARAGRFIVGAEQVQRERQVAVSPRNVDVAKRASAPNQRIASGAGRVAVRHDSANPGLLQDIAADPRGQQILAIDEPPGSAHVPLRTGLRIEDADVVVRTAGPSA